MLEADVFLFLCSSRWITLLDELKLQGFHVHVSALEGSTKTVYKVANRLLLTMALRILCADRQHCT